MMFGYIVLRGFVVLKYIATEFNCVTFYLSGVSKSSIQVFKLVLSNLNGSTSFS